MLGLQLIAIFFSWQVTRKNSQNFAFIYDICSEEWLMKLMKLAELDKLMSLIIEKTVSILMADWKPLIDFLHETEKYFTVCNLDAWGKMDNRKGEDFL